MTIRSGHSSKIEESKCDVTASGHVMWYDNSSDDGADGKEVDEDE